MIHIVHYNQKERKFVLHIPELNTSELIDAILLKDAIFFVSAPCQKIIRERRQTMEDSKAKFPHAFALSTVREESFEKVHDTSLLWQNFEYDVFIHDSFVLSETQAPISGLVRYVFINGMELKVVL